MPKFNVQMTRLAVVFREEEIEADSKEAAEKEAMKQFKDDNQGGHGWKIDDIFDDGKPHAKLEIIDVTELDEDGFPVES